MHTWPKQFQEVVCFHVYPCLNYSVQEIELFLESEQTVHGVLLVFSLVTHKKKEMKKALSRIPW